MLNSYKARVDGEHIVWMGKKPKGVTRGRPVTVEVSLLAETLTPSARKRQGKKLADILENLAILNPFADVADPVAWVRELRADQILPGRE